ncbi:MAG: hypothetical protein QY327_05565 [Fimbriimonadaceae bacterium]|nr:MAG: hypothetical protein QY327_05565 [Fimbriimonadaceae bacterium]
MGELFADRIGGAAGLAEPALGIGEPGAGVDRVAQFLVGQLLARDVDDLEPVELFLVRALADVDLELVVKDLLLPDGGEVAEEVGRLVDLDSEVAHDVLAEANRALLPVHEFVTPSPLRGRGGGG